MVASSDLYELLHRLWNITDVLDGCAQESHVIVQPTEIIGNGPTTSMCVKRH